MVAAVAGFTAVALGAFGAHALRDSLDTQMLQVYRTASLYHLVHAAVLLAIALWLQQGRISGWLKFSAWSFCTGIVLFSGSLYLLAVTGVSGLGAITPLGGLAFLAGWAGIFIHAVRSR